jgi:hypothetical protein
LNIETGAKDIATIRADVAATLNDFLFTLS